MTRSIFGRYVLPFIQWFALMILIAIAFDYFLHRLQLVYIGSYLGPIGTLVLILSFVYSLRKRKIIEFGSPRQLLIIHEYMAWGGSILILIHAGIHFHTLLPWLATLMLVITVASGLVGKFLLKGANDTYREKLKTLTGTGMTRKEAQKELFFDSITVDLMKKWRVVHLPLALLLGILSLMHIITVIMFSK